MVRNDKKVAANIMHIVSLIIIKSRAISLNKVEKINVHRNGIMQLPLSVQQL